MKTNFGMVMAIYVLLTAELCPGQLYWKKSCKINGSREAYAMTRTTDGNFIIAGRATITVPGISIYSSYLLKVTPFGDTVWSRICGGVEANAIVKAQDETFMVSGITFSNGNGADYYAFRVGPTGDTLWTREYGGSYDDFASSLIEVQDGNFLITGESMSSIAPDQLFALKINLQGDVVWSRTYGGALSVLSRLVMEEKDGNCLIGGWYDTLNSGCENIQLGTLAPGGDIISTRKYPLGFCAVPDQIVRTDDGGFLIMGAARQPGNGQYGIGLLKLDQNGDTLWSRIFVGPVDYLTNCIVPSYDGGFIITAYTYSNGDETPAIFLLKVNQNGDSIWTRTFGDANCYYYPKAICQTLDSNFLVAAIRDSFQSDSKIFLLSIIDDRYAWKNSPFTFKIPVSGDSLNHGYTPLKVPSGMAVSQGGTVSWTPTTDSVYAEHTAFLVVDDFGGKDTLSFNIFVNSKDHPNKTINPISHSVNPSLNSISIHSISSGEVRFSLPSGISSLRVYDLRGQLLENLSVRNNQATWSTNPGAGRYFAKAIFERGEMVKGFTVVR